MGFTKILNVSAGAGGGSIGLGLQATKNAKNKAIQIIFILRVKKILERNKFTVYPTNFITNKQINLKTKLGATSHFKRLRGQRKDVPPGTRILAFVVSSAIGHKKIQVDDGHDVHQ